MDIEKMHSQTLVADGLEEEPKRAGDAANSPPEAAWEKPIEWWKHRKLE